MRRFEKVEAYIQEQELDREVIEQAEIQVKYSGYIEKEKNNADKLNRLENIRIPANFDYSKINYDYLTLYHFAIGRYVDTYIQIYYRSKCA